jgi:hypothetical protein
MIVGLIILIVAVTLAASALMSLLAIEITPLEFSDDEDD